MEKQKKTKSILPDKYQQVEYIESTRIQWLEIEYNNINDNTNTYYYKYLQRNPAAKSCTIMDNKTLINNQRFGQLCFRMDQKTTMLIGKDLSATSKFYTSTELNAINEVTVIVDNKNSKYLIQ